MHHLPVRHTAVALMLSQKFTVFRGKLEKFRVQRGAARHLATALGDDARDAFRRALLQGRVTISPPQIVPKSRLIALMPEERTSRGVPSWDSLALPGLEKPPRCKRWQAYL